QLLLCFKVKSLIIRLLPVIVFTLLTAVNVCLAYAAGDWDAIAYLAIGVLTLIMLAACGIGWGVWGISRLFRRKK
ncbi:MAG: hypothetical protein HUJ65_06145, partial [Oscillospiraceae bacterium]|nr:hypothetical protein [Oscillospiraceae bacterium]